jgi:hypothetical protein
VTRQPTRLGLPAKLLVAVNIEDAGNVLVVATAKRRQSTEVTAAMRSPPPRADLW